MMRDHPSYRRHSATNCHSRAAQAVRRRPWSFSRSCRQPAPPSHGGQFGHVVNHGWGQSAFGHQYMHVQTDRRELAPGREAVSKINFLQVVNVRYLNCPRCAAAAEAVGQLEVFLDRRAAPRPARLPAAVTTSGSGRFAPGFGFDSCNRRADVAGRIATGRIAASNTQGSSRRFAKSCRSVFSCAAKALLMIQRRNARNPPPNPQGLAGFGWQLASRILRTGECAGSMLAVGAGRL